MVVGQMKNLMIGLFVIAAGAVVVFTLLFLHPTVGDEGRTLRVRFADIDKVNVGTRVTYGGKAVGEVAEIDEISEASMHRKAQDGVVYIYELKLEVDSGVNIFNSDEIALRTSGLLGERSVAITPMPPKPGEKLRLVNDQIIYAVEVGTVEDTVKELKEVANKFDVALDSITAAFNDVREQEMIKNISAAAKNIAEITDALNKPDEWSDLLVSAADVMDNLKEATDKLNNGKGTIGRLLTEDDLYLRFTSILNKGETVMNDINHYGILFHLDKGWKRLRARRMNLMQKLSCPAEFRNYFNDEIDHITTSLSRVSMILEDTEDCPAWKTFMDDCRFQKVFAELLRRVEGMEESLKMYNQQVVDTKVKETELS